MLKRSLFIFIYFSILPYILHAQATVTSNKRKKFFVSTQLSVNRLLLRDELASPLNLKSTSVPFNMRIGIEGKHSVHKLSFDWYGDEVINRNGNTGDILLGTLEYLYLRKLRTFSLEKWDFYIGGTLKSYGRDMNFVANDDFFSSSHGELFIDLKLSLDIRHKFKNENFISYQTGYSLITYLVHQAYNPRNVNLDFGKGDFLWINNFLETNQVFKYHVNLNPTFSLNFLYELILYRYQQPHLVKVVQGRLGIELVIKL